jgi:hypothetical protein
MRPARSCRSSCRCEREPADEDERAQCPRRRRAMSCGSNRRFSTWRPWRRGGLFRSSWTRAPAPTRRLTHWPIREPRSECPPGARWRPGGHSCRWQPAGTTAAERRHPHDLRAAPSAATRPATRHPLPLHAIHSRSHPSAPISATAASARKAAPKDWSHWGCQSAARIAEASVSSSGKAGRMPTGTSLPQTLSKTSFRGSSFHKEIGRSGVVRVFVVRAEQRNTVTVQASNGAARTET